MGCKTMNLVSSQLSGAGWVFLAGEACQKLPTPLLFEMILNLSVFAHAHLIKILVSLDNRAEFYRIWLIRQSGGQ
jgi:hypothetical protein